MIKKIKNFTKQKRTSKQIRWSIFFSKKIACCNAANYLIINTVTEILAKIYISGHRFRDTLKSLAIIA